MDHIDDMDQLRQGIGLQASDRDPLVEYKMIGYDMFGEMTCNRQWIQSDFFFHVNVEQKVEENRLQR